METVDDEILQNTFAFIDKAKQDNKPFFRLAQPHAHCTSSPIFRKNTRTCRNSENGWSVSEGGFAQLDDIVGARDEEAQGTRKPPSSAVPLPPDERRLPPSAR